MTSTDQAFVLGQSRVFLDLMDRVSEMAPLDRPILVVGERGTGKELIASRLHYLSNRWEKPFITVNSAALPDSLLESELFGYEPGAFTGAQKRRLGRFELADGGTLFLDEIGTMSMAAQEKLLRIVEYGTFERLGGVETLTTNVRVIGAANVDLPSFARQGRFRLDLLDRLSFDVLTIPPLRARKSDILELATHFANGIALELGWEKYPGFSEKAQELLISYPWPGNVRELKNTAERAVYRWQDENEPIDQIVFDPFESPWRPVNQTEDASGKEKPEPSRITTRASSDTYFLLDAKQPIDLNSALLALERKLLENALRTNRYHQKQTAEHLSLSYDQFRHKLKKHGLLHQQD